MVSTEIFAAYRNQRERDETKDHCEIDFEGCATAESDESEFDCF
jgi:hypothetical protein